MKSCSFRLISDNVVTVVCDCEPCFVIINRLHEFSFSSCLLLTTVELAINYVLWWCIDCMIAVLSHFASTSPDLQSGCISTAFQLEIWAKFLIWCIFFREFGCIPCFNTRAKIRDTSLICVCNSQITKFAIFDKTYPFFVIGPPHGL